MADLSNMKVGLICLQVKCDHYWPYTDAPVTYGEITVEMLSEKESPEWTVRNFRLSYVSETFPALTMLNRGIIRSATENGDVATRKMAQCRNETGLSERRQRAGATLSNRIRDPFHH